MAVTLKDVRAALEPEEPDYDEAAKLGSEAIPHIEALVASGDSMIASKATYLAGLIGHDKSPEIVQAAARSDDPVVRVAAAAATANLPPAGASATLVELVGDPDPGVRKVARAAVPDKPTAKLAKKLEEMGDEGEPAAGAEGPLTSGGRMPGEPAGDAPGSVGSAMPGEGPRGMPGEDRKMPGE